MAKSRPGAGTRTGRVWDIADQISVETGEPALRRSVVDAAKSEGINPSTANTQFGHWKRATWPGAKPISERLPSREIEGPGFVWSDLLKNGFSYCADWRPGNDGAPEPDQDVPAEKGVYAFVCEERIVYVGVTSRTLRERMSDYRRGHRSQKTSARLNQLIRDALFRGETVRIFCAVPGMSEWNGFPVDIALGLERGLIDKLKPSWNKV